MIPLIFIFTIIFVNPDIWLEKCIVGDHLGTNFKGTELLIQKMEGFEYF